MKITALRNTFLKELTAQSNTPGNKTIDVEKGEVKEVLGFLKREDKHSLLEFQKIGNWYVFDEHWDLSELPSDVVFNATSKNLKSVEISANFIKQFEGEHLEAYPDPAHGWKVPTIGYGTTIYPEGVRVERGDRITKAQAQDYLELWIYKEILPQLSKIPTWWQMNDGQKAALISFAYNLGANFYKNHGFASITLVCDTPSKWGDHAWVKGQFEKYRNPGTDLEEGLKRRRHAEADLFCPPPKVSTPASTGLVTAIFTLKQAGTNQLIEGKLTFSSDGKDILSVVATSGAPGFQYAGAHTIRGKGCIPPGNHWKINTDGYYLATKGIEGQFFHITPDPWGGRSELGLHRDANVPGSAGCVVVRNSDSFNKKVVPFIEGLKQTQINLSVIYG